jgi:hypothetical protein
MTIPHPAGYCLIEGQKLPLALVLYFHKGWQTRSFCAMRCLTPATQIKVTSRKGSNTLMVTMIVKDGWGRRYPGGVELVGLGFVSQIGPQPSWNVRKKLSIQE